MNRPLVTLAMPVRNCEKTIAVAVRSILNQTLPDWELLVLDDGSTDSTISEVLRFKDCRIKVFHDNQSKGLPVRLNEAIRITLGEYYARMDGDDVCYPKRLEMQVDYMRSHAEVDLLGGGLCVFGKEGRAVGKRISPANHDEICRRPYAGFPMAHPAFLGKRSWFQRWGFGTGGGACDQDLLLRSYTQSRFANLKEILLGYREEGIVFRKCFSYRMGFCSSLVARYEGMDVLRVALGWALNATKLSVEAFAITSGLEYKILEHRARPITEAEGVEWNRVWQICNQSQ